MNEMTKPPVAAAAAELPPNPQDLPNHPELVESWPLASASFTTGWGSGNLATCG